MKKRLCMYITLSVALLFAASGNALAEEIGRIAAIKGSVTIKRGLITREATLNAPLFVKDIIETASGSRAKVLMKDDSVVTISENSTVSLKDYVLTKEPSKSKSIFGLIDGGIRALVSKGRFSRFEVHTPTSIVGVKGTYFSVWLEYMPDGRPVTYIALHEGDLGVNSNIPSIVDRVSLKPGQMTRVIKDEAPEPPIDIPDTKKEELLNCSPQ